MKKVLLTLTLSVSILGWSNVGVDTQNPQATFHVDGAKNNPETGNPTADQQKDDVVVTKEGRVGIGTMTPSTNIEIQTGGTSASPKTGIKLVDGNQGLGKILTSDKDGNARWESNSLIEVQGVYTEFGVNIPLYYLNTNMYHTGANITLPPGKWIVSVYFLMRIAMYDAQMTANQFAWLRSTLSDSPTSMTPTADLLLPSAVSGYFAGPSSTKFNKYQIFNGFMVIDNKSSNNKTYYLIAGDVTTEIPESAGVKMLVADKGVKENILFATPIQ